eukprot:COSAG01_NODE_45852_length_405_cov_2.986928_1_plen_49_part_10
MNVEEYKGVVCVLSDATSSEEVPARSGGERYCCLRHKDEHDRLGGVVCF